MNRPSVLDQFRVNKPADKRAAERPDDAPPPSPAPAPDAEIYLAYKAVDRRQLRLHVRPVGASWEWVTYSYLLRVVSDGRRCTRLALIFTFMAVVIEGKNLHKIAEAIASEHCDFIEAFDPKEWKKPTDPEAAFIQSIEYVVEGAPAKAAEQEAA